MRHVLSRFWKSEEGAVTVDWVVITAAMVGLAVLVVASVQQAAVNESSGIGAQIGDVPVGVFTVPDN